MISPPTRFAGKLIKFGASLKFVDDSTLVVRVQSSTNGQESTTGRMTSRSQFARV